MIDLFNVLSTSKMGTSHTLYDSLYPIGWTILVGVAIYFSPKVFHWLRVVYYTLPRDLGALILFMKTKFLVRRFRLQNATVPRVFRDVVNRHPDKLAILSHHKSFTFRQLDAYSNRVANFLQREGFVKGDEMSLIMEGRPEFVGLWLGASKAGCVTALINIHLKQASLLHSITCIPSRAVICSDKYVDNLREIYPELVKKVPGIKIFVYGQQNNNPDTESDQTTSGMSCSPMNDQVLDTVSDRFSKAQMEGDFGDKLFYVYTSGTTGLPKAAIIRHARYLFLGTGGNSMVGLGGKHTIYSAIPLYHMAGGALGTCQMTVFGNTLVIREKFSASNFWKDCRQFKCTAAQYIGEICRYLVVQPEGPDDKDHGVKVLFGNGLRENIWREFKTRFNIKLIAEFYGATEGNANVVNYTGKEGSCGFVSQILPTPIVNLIYPVSIIRVNEDSGEPVRGPDGLCITCGPNECGEFVGKIITSDPTRSFDGYANKEATEKKIYRNVFRKGDLAFSSGDLLMIDTYGYVFFKDRTGDTFRWKGENVSTTEVETVIMDASDQADVVVFGIEVPGIEGRAGMAALVDKNRTLDMSRLYNRLKDNLPSYSIPVFVRVTDSIETTGTYKLPKVALKKQGFNPTVEGDNFYYLTEKGYKPLNYSTYEDILNGQVRF